MANMEFCDKHNMVAFLQKPTSSEEFHHIVDFLAGSHIRYALTTNHTIYVSLTEQFWQTATVDTVNDGEQQIIVIVDVHKIAITKASVRRHLQLADADEVHVPLFDTMLLHDHLGHGDRPTLTVESQHTPIASPHTSQPTASQPLSPQDHPSQNKKVYGKAFTKLVKKVKHLKDKLKSTTLRRKVKMVITDDEEDLVSENPSKQGRMAKITPTKAPQGDEQRQESFEAQLGVLSASKILADASKERVKTYNRRRRSTDSSRDSTAGGLFSTAKEIQDKEQISTNEEIAHKLNEEEMLDERKEIDNIDWDNVVEQVQEKETYTIIRYQTLKKKPVSAAQAMRNMMIYLKNMAGYKMGNFKGISYDKIRPIFEKVYNKIQTLFKNDTQVEKTKKKRVAEETLLQESFKKLRTVEASIKERFRSAKRTKDMEKALWVELKRLFKPDKDDTLWKLQRYMHDPLTWRLYGSCGVHHVSSTRGHDIYMLTEKDYPLSTTVMGLMLSRRLQVEEDSEMARDLVMKIFIEANKPRI
ncbi:hypothetical protein Tco_0930717 [Tanacetum coccineum]